jgi:signal transduction histidine kinase
MAGGTLDLTTTTAGYPRQWRPTRALPRLLRALLRAPLVAKLAGANALIVVAASGATLLAHGTHPGAGWLLGATGVALLAAGAVNLALVHLALRPLGALERTAERVWRGDLEARVPGSPLADRDMARVGRTINLLLDALADDRARMRRLAAQVISAQDGERSRIARELHDSTAQTLAGLMFQISAAARDAAPGERDRLESLRDMATAALEEVRTLSHTVYPRVLDDLGLVAALEWLARRARERGTLDVAVDAEAVNDLVPAASASVLYGVAQEALRNAERHSGAEAARITLRVEGRAVAMVVADGGRGFDVAEAEGRRPGMGLFTMRERVALVEGRLAIDSTPGAGTRVCATVPLARTHGAPAGRRAPDEE